MGDILTYISGFIPDNYEVLRYILLAAFSLLSLDVVFGVVIALFGKLFR